MRSYGKGRTRHKAQTQRVNWNGIGIWYGIEDRLWALERAASTSQQEEKKGIQKEAR